jgi:hypothetical protein
MRVGDGVNDPTISVNGTLNAINAALTGMTFTPNPGFTGTASILCRTHDYGNTGIGGLLYGAEKTININVAAN